MEIHTEQTVNIIESEMNRFSECKNKMTTINHYEFVVGMIDMARKLGAIDSKTSIELSKNAKSFKVNKLNSI